MAGNANQPRTALLAFLRSHRGGGMLVTCVFTIMLLTVVGSLMVNYAFRESQWEELRGGLRAAVSSAGALLGGGDEAAEARVGEFVRGLLPALTLDEVTVTYDPATEITTVAVTGQYQFRDLWLLGDGDRDPVDIEERTRVRFEVDRYEVALALDVSTSMRDPMSYAGTQIQRIDGLKLALNAAIDVMAEVTTTNPGSMMAALVPFAAAVSVADTCNPDDNGRCQADLSAAKERYVRMLAGADGTLDQARNGARDSGGQWVDSFHHYGASPNLGPLQAMSLPDDLLDDRSWDLRREDVEIDVAAQVPNAPVWTVDDRDFWNGCVMARWGAYWNEDARPPGWTADNPANWPATQAVPGWTDAAATLASNTPLHLSDAPPDARDPNTLFTAYSWPDAGIGNTADHILQGVMLGALESIEFGGVSGQDWHTREVSGDNRWSFDLPPVPGGASLCPATPLTPLSENTTELRDFVDSLQAEEESRLSPTSSGATYLPLGVVWALRAVSPLWRDVWRVADESGYQRPGTPCAPGETGQHCDERLNKSILLLSDGDNAFGGIGRRLLVPLLPNKNNPLEGDGVLRSDCNRLDVKYPNYNAAVAAQSEAEFNREFSSYVDASDHFEPGRMDPVLDVFSIFLDRMGPTNPYLPASPSDSPEVRASREAALSQVTPWQIFRGIDNAGAIDLLLNPDNGFGLDGRPVGLGHYCRWSSSFGPYGRLDDAVRVGESNGRLLDPVFGVAPFSLPDGIDDTTRIRKWANDQLDNWLTQTCGIAGQRRVRINAVFLGNSTHSGVQTLKNCVSAAGGDPDRDVYVTPTADELISTFVDLFTVRRKLRFLD